MPRKIVDLTHSIEKTMSMFPNLPTPEVIEFLSHEAAASHDTEGTSFVIHRYNFSSAAHTYGQKVRNVLMKNVLLLIFILASGLALSTSVLDQSAATTNSVQPRHESSAAQKKNEVASEIKRLEHELAQAVVARDYAALQRIEAETYVWTASDAVVTTRDEAIRQFKAGTSQVTSLRFDDMAVDTYGDAAVVRGILTVERETNGVKVSRRARYTRFYVRFPAGWRAVAGHSSTLKTT